MTSEIEVYKKNMQALNEFSNRFKGLDRAVAIVESTAGLGWFVRLRRLISPLGVSSSKIIALNL